MKTNPVQELAEAILSDVKGDLNNPDTVFFLLQFAGDLVRLGECIPETFRAKMKQIPTETILASLELRVEDIKAWSLPIRYWRDPEGEPWIEWALHRRDELESHLLACRLIMMPRGILVDTTPEVERIQVELARHDLSCGGQLPRQDAEMYMGDRKFLVSQSSWLDNISWKDAVEDEECPWHTSYLPPKSTLEAYVTHGREAKWVEQAAKEDPETKSWLVESIRDFSECAAVSPIAARWLAQQDPR